MGEGVTTNPVEGAAPHSDPLSRLLHVALLLFGLIAAALRLSRRRQPPMETAVDSPSADPPAAADSSFFTWDSGGSSGEYSFVHTAVELPKYPENAITEEERQMLLLYMQSGHPEMLIAQQQQQQQAPEPRGFLETIVEETSDDLRSPSECDETSLGWGSWDESDEDRLTVVEMATHSSEYVLKHSGPPSLPREATVKCGKDSGAVLVFSDGHTDMDTMTLKPGVSPISNNSLDALWITPDALEGPESLDPWTNCEFKTPSDDLTSLDFTVNTNNSNQTENSLLVMGLDDLCLVPSKTDESEELMFSDNFKDYFLPASDHLTPKFNKDEAFEQSSLDTPDILSNIPEQKSLRCFRIGFESGPSEQVALSLLDDTHVEAEDFSKSDKNEDYSNLRPIIKSDASHEEAMFSPVDGDIVFGSTWVSGRDVKEPEKNTASGAEVHCPDPPAPADDNRIPHLQQSASDDEAAAVEVPKSLSRWQHHTDLQHVQEATSPLTRWQHHHDERGEPKPEQADYSEESDDGLPPQLKEIYSSFKMKDNKMGRIRIKEDKNNNFKRLGLWDNESKVTLPPFKPSLIEPPINNIPKPVENGGGSREDLDDLEFDMFSTQSKPKQNGEKPSPNCDSDIDDALRSFNHLDDYSSLSDDGSEAESGSPIDVKELENALSAIAQCSDVIPTTEAGPSSLEKTCSDTSDSCPLCTDPIERKDNLFGAENGVECMIPKTKVLTLTHLSNSDDSEQNADSLTKQSDSVSPLTTTSDSDEGVRAVKEVKKRTKKRPNKDTQSCEMKHDDSGYVEDDEDDEEDYSLEEKLEKESPTLIKANNADVVRSTRKSISAAYYESKSKQGDDGFDSGNTSSQIPSTCEEFSEQSSRDELEKWRIPENLSQFSAWLLDKELNKINRREEVEKMVVDDMMKLREQTIADFLRNTSSAEQKIILNSAGLTTGRQILATIEEIETRNSGKDKTDFTDPFVLKPQPVAFDISPGYEHAVDDDEEDEKDNTQSSDDTSDKSDSDKGALTEEYYNYNVNSHVSSIMFREPNRSETIEKETGKGCDTIENKAADTFCASWHDTETHAIGNAETLNSGVHHPPADDSSSEPSLEPSIGPAIPAETLLQPKVKDTTIGAEKQNEAEAPSDEAMPIENVDDDSRGELHSVLVVAPSGEGGENYSEGDADLLTPPGGAREEKEEADGIATLEGVASHVLSGDDDDDSLLHAHCEGEEASNVSTDDKDDCALNIIIADDSFKKESGARGISAEKVNSGEVDCFAPTSPAEFTSAPKALDGCDAGSGVDSLTFGYSTEEVCDSSSLQLLTNSDVDKPVLIPDSDVRPSSDSDVADKPVPVNTQHTCERTDTEKRVSRTPGNFFGPIDCVNAPLTVPSGILSTTLEDLTQIAQPDLISETPDPDLPVLRNEYKRSNSLGREPAESFEPLTSQSKSTPDLRRCHQLNPNSSAPLSALLSKSVSQRIHDYLGRSDHLSRRSLPPCERSRHYRRICVSTETVVERAAKFEARSKSTGPVKAHEQTNSRSGSCPPNMRNSTWRGLSNGHKPTAAVKPTVGPMSEERRFELITGYEQASRVTHKPPVPPGAPSIHQTLKSARLKGKIASARKDFFERLSKNEMAKSTVEVNVEVDEDEEGLSPGMGLSRFTAFRKSAREERARLAASHPDLGALEAAVRSSRRKIDQLKRQQNQEKEDQEGSVGPMPSTVSKGPYRRCTGEIAWASCAERLRAARAPVQGQQLEIVDVRAQPEEAAAIAAAAGGCGGDFSRARSMDFLLDADNRERVQPPENALAAGKARVKSEHELRIERSLQNLTIPDWYKQSAWSTKPKEGFILRRGSEGSAGESRKRWQGLGSSRTPSTTSLTSYSQRHIAVPKRVTAAHSTGDWRGSLVSSRESLTPASPASLSPRECSSAAFQYGLSSTSLSRWSSSRLSTSSAPLTALSVHRSFRQPYLGWRAAAASSSGGASPGVSPVNATTPVQGSRPSSPRRGSQEHHFGYGLQQNQITSAATLRPDGSEAPDANRISPLALNTTNVFFNSHVEPPHEAEDDPPPARFPSSTEMRRDRYSYTQSLYSGATMMATSPQEEDQRNFNHLPDGSSSPRVWMESSFVGTKRGDGSEPPPPRSIRIVPSSTAAGGSTCATQTAMGEYVLRDFRRFGITL